MSHPSRLDEILPRYDFGEEHAIVVEAPPGIVYRAVKEVTPGEIPPLLPLFALRALPARLLGSAELRFSATEPLIDQMSAATFALLADDAGQEVLIGAVGQVWKVVGGEWRLPDGLADFTGSAEPGYARVLMNVAIEPRPDGCLVRTETRVALADDASRVSFSRYWRVIKPGSAFIRRAFLRAVKRRAEMEAGGPGEGARR